MEIRKTKISEEDLISKYLPVDHWDSFECAFESDKNITPDEVQVVFWTRFPRWIERLFRLRDILVKPFGIKTGKSDKEAFINCIRSGGNYRFVSVSEKSEDETIICMNDVHLIFYFSAKVTQKGNKEKIIKLTTLVNYHNNLGKIYFLFVMPFHNIIMKSMLKHLTKAF